MSNFDTLNPLLGVQIVHLVDRTDLFKVSNLVNGKRGIVTSLYSSLQEQRQFMAGIVSLEVAVCQCQNLWLMDFFLNN